MKPIELKTSPEQTQTITRVIFDILKEHGPLTVGDTWERVKEVGLRGLTSKRHMKIVLRWMRERQKIRLICNHVGPHKQFLYTTWFTKPNISHTRAVHNSSTSTTSFSVDTSSPKLSSVIVSALQQGFTARIIVHVFDKMNTPSAKHKRGCKCKRTGRRWKNPVFYCHRIGNPLCPVDEMLRHASVSSVARLLSSLCSHDQISSIFWILHSDLHEARVTAVLEYLLSLVARISRLGDILLKDTPLRDSVLKALNGHSDHGRIEMKKILPKISFTLSLQMRSKLLLLSQQYTFSSSSAHVSGLGDLNMPYFMQLAVKCDKN
ncbi:hypothetical protein GOBAR_DD22344 [Gossypium barbadense]|nr:hypothetical protein GOBAR_DD22344 [Gossypium barbadense]